MEAPVKRENSRPITSWHIILPSPQNTINYKAPRTATRFCYHYTKTNRNLPSVIEIGALKACKNQSHIDTCKQWHKQPGACKRWCMQSNRVLTCVTLKIKTFRPIKRCHVSWRKSLKTPPIRLWHMSPIKLCYMSLTHPQTPINRSLPKVFLHNQDIQSTSSMPQSLQELQKLQPQIWRTFKTKSSKLPV